MNTSTQSHTTHVLSISASASVSVNTPLQYNLLLMETIHYYRPQTKFAKVMFLQVPVCPGGGLPGQVPPGRYTPPGQVHPPLPPGRYTPGRYTPPVGTPPTRQVHPWQVQPLTRQVHPLAGTTSHPTGTPPGQVHRPAKVHAGIRSTSGRYASHWYAFLWVHSFTDRIGQKKSPESGMQNYGK